MNIGTAGSKQPDAAYGQQVPSSTFNDAEPSGWSEIAAWRRSMRQALLQRRTQMPVKERDAASTRIAAALDGAIGRVAGRTIGAYWPIKGEPNLYRWMLKAFEMAATVALPVVIRKGWPLEFRRWQPGAPLERGVWNIPVPANGPAVLPDVLVVPLVGFDGERFRLGYGGGFYDRTIAAAAKRPYLIGVGFDYCRLPTIYPQPHDIRMDAIVTDA
jgi:5,10-methenyltetrahydrofolate synthetase